MSRGIRVLIALFTGGYIGSVVALDISRSFWFECIGMFVGAVLTWVICDYKEIVAAAPIAWRRATNWRWQPDKIYWRECFRAAGMLAIWFLWVGVLFLGLLIFLAPDPFSTSLGEFWSMVALTFCMISVLSISLACDANPKEREKMANGPGPLTIFFTVILPAFLKAGIWLIKNIPAGARALGRFAKHLFLLTYSDEKLLFSVSAAFGVGIGIGYYFSHAIVGGIAAVILGIPNFEIVSVRWLKLVPAEQSLFRRR